MPLQCPLPICPSSKDVDSCRESTNAHPSCLRVASLGRERSPCECSLSRSTVEVSGCQGRTSMTGMDRAVCVSKVQASTFGSGFVRLGVQIRWLPCASVVGQQQHWIRRWAEPYWMRSRLGIPGPRLAVRWQCLQLNLPWTFLKRMCLLGRRRLAGLAPPW